MPSDSNGTGPAFSLVIDGADVKTAASFEVLDPVTQKLVHTAPAATAEDAVRAVEAAEKAFATWRHTTPLERRTVLMRAAAALERRMPDLVKAMVAETGALPSWAAFNAKLGVGFVHEAAGMASQIKGDLLPSNDHGTLALVFREPVGVILGIAPWNAPIILGIRAFITPLVCGNAVILKASEASPLTQYLLVDAFREAGLPAGVLSFLCCPRASASPVTEAILAHSAVQRVNFTGSTAVGRIIAAVAAKYLKPAILELGGKAPMVVLKDANVPEAVKAAAFGALQHQGQICMSTERVIVHRARFDEFAALLKAKFDSLHAADPRVDATAQLGSVITQAAGGRVHALLQDAVAKGAQVVGGRVDVQGAIIQPVALTGITPAMDLYAQESFGPVVTLFAFDTTDEAIALANDTEYGLVSSVYSDNITEALEVARQIRSGSCHINGPTVHDEPHLPLGGQKASGYGRFGGLSCIREFTEERVVTLGAHGHSYPI